MEKEEEVECDAQDFPITKKEFEASFRELKHNNTCGIYDIPADLLQQTDEETKSILHSLIYQNYRNG